MSERSRVILLGGLAIIAHGLSRTTEDADIWLDSMLPIEKWTTTLEAVAGQFPGAYFWDLARRERMTDIRETVEDFGVIRIGGLDRYLDIFRRPNQLAESDFDAAWKASSPHLGNIRLLEEAFLIATKVDSGRDKDMLDIHFLEARLRETLTPRLRVCSLREAEEIFTRFADHVTYLAAMENPEPAVRALGIEGLLELAESNNPFAIEALKKFDAGA